MSMWFELHVNMPSVLWRCWLGGRKGIRTVKKTVWWGAGMVICLERDADLHTAQMMPLPLTVTCFSEIQTDFTFLVSAYPGHGQRVVKRVCVSSEWQQGDKRQFRPRSQPYLPHDWPSDGVVVCIVRSNVAEAFVQYRDLLLTVPPRWAADSVTHSHRHSSQHCSASRSAYGARSSQPATAVLPNIKYDFSKCHFIARAFSAFTLLVGRQEEHPPLKLRPYGATQICLLLLFIIIIVK